MNVSVVFCLKIGVIFFIDNVHPVWIAWFSCLSDSVPEGVNVILDHRIILAHKFSDRWFSKNCFKFLWWSPSLSGVITSTIQAIAENDNIKTCGLKDCGHKHDGKEEEEQEFIDLVDRSRHQVNHGSEIVVILDEIQSLFCKHHQNQDGQPTLDDNHGSWWIDIIAFFINLDMVIQWEWNFSWIHFEQEICQL